MKKLHFVAATLGGMLAGGLSVGGVQWLSALTYPVPPDVDINKRAEAVEWIQTLPIGAFLFVLVSWIVGAFVAAVVGRLLAPKRIVWPGVIACAMLLSATILNLIALPHPWWIAVAGVLAYPAFGSLGLQLISGRDLTVTTDREVNAEIEKVFSTLADISNFKHAVPGIVNVEFLSEQQYGVGTRFRETRLMNGKEASTELEVTELVENEQIRIISDAGGAIWDTEFRVSNEGPIVKMRMQMDARPYTLFSQLVTPTILTMVRKAVEEDMDAVKQYCESE